MYFTAWLILLSSRLHKAALSKSLNNEAKEYKKLLSDIVIDVLNRKVGLPLKSF